MNAVKNLLSITAGGAFGELILGLGPRDAGLVVAIVSACVIGVFAIRAVQANGDDDRRLERERVWMRREQDPSWTALLHDFEEK